MKLKSYFSATVEAAMELARKELGDDAMLIHSRPATPETRYLGTYEVVFGTQPGGAGPQACESTGLGAGPTATDRLSQDVAELRRQIQMLSSSLRAPAAEAPANRSELRSILSSQEVDAQLVDQVASGTPLERTFSTDATLGRPGATRAVVALVGPPGAGQATALMKLAARYGLACRKPVHILTADVFRIAAADQLRALAAILGIGCDVAETPVALAQLLEEYRSKQMVLIDTPGLSFRDMEDGADLARLLATHPEVDTHLVLPASMKASDMARFADRYAVFQPKKLIFTRIDETTQYGALVSEAAKRSLPVSFLATGQQIPDDLEEATSRRLTELILGENSVPNYFGAAA